MRRALPSKLALFTAATAGVVVAACTDVPTEAAGLDAWTTFPAAKGGTKRPAANDWPQIIVEYAAGAGDAGYKIYGDGIDDQTGTTASDGSGTYTAGICGVTGQLFDAEGYSYDAVLNPARQWKKGEGCTMRTLFFDYSDELDGGPGLGFEHADGWSWGFMNIGHSVADLSTTGIADDNHFNLNAGLPTPWVAFEATFVTELCNEHLVFDPDYDLDTVDPRVSKVQVRRVASTPGCAPGCDPAKRMWEARALPPNDVAYCQQPGRGKNAQPPRYFHMPFRLFIREQ